EFRRVLFRSIVARLWNSTAGFGLPSSTRVRFFEESSSAGRIAVPLNYFRYCTACQTVFGISWLHACPARSLIRLPPYIWWLMEKSILNSLGAANPTA